MITKDEPDTRYALLVYDIPQSSKLRNPSNLLRRRGARINLSCWVLPLKNLALLPLKLWEEKGATVEVVEFDEHERDKVMALARRSIRADVEAMRKHIERSVAAVRSRYKAAAKLALGEERDESTRKAGHYAYVLLYRAKEAADAATEAALAFDMTGDVDDLVDALRRSIKAKSALFYSLAEEVKPRHEVAS